MLLVLGQRKDEHFTRAFDNLGWEEGSQFIVIDRYESPALSVVPGDVPGFLAEVDIVWPRIKPPFTKEAFCPEGTDERNFFHTEWNVFDGFINSVMPAAAFVQRMSWHNPEDSKMVQLAVAKELGFRIPRSIVSTDADRVEEFFQSWPIVFKPLTAVPAGPKGPLLTTMLDRSRFMDLRQVISRCPGIFQQFIRKKEEWRVNVFGRRVFAAVVRRGRNNEDVVDWRLVHGQRGALEPIDIPVAIERACLRFLETFSLRHAAFDFAVDEDGEVYFLECNPAGQYTFVEDHTGQPLSSAMASLVLAMTKERGGDVTAHVGGRVSRQEIRRTEA